jgi:hypothetical protein
MIVQMEHPIMGPAPLLLDRDGPAAVVTISRVAAPMPHIRFLLLSLI